MKSQFVLAAFATCFTICVGAPPLFPIGDSHNEDVNQISRQELVDRAGDGATNQYWLFTRQNPTNKQILVLNDHRSVLGSNYDGGRGTVVLAHGWRNDGNTDMNPLITAAFLDVMDVNVIVLDWSYYCNSFYTRASIAVPSVGNYLGDFIMWLFNCHGGDWHQLHLVGFSLGAHVVGNAGRRAGGRAARVTGLDPASFSWGGNQYALNTESARYVEVIHTDGRICGIMDAIGHSDFYPNGGQHPQPGCWFNPCSHGRVTEYFASSVRNPNHFVARRCRNKYEAELGRCAGDEVVMGNGDVKKFASGLFGLWTTDRYPF